MRKPPDPHQRHRFRPRRQRLKLDDKWHLDEVFAHIQGKLHSLWRTIDQDGNVRDVLVQGRRDAKTARRFFMKLIKGLQDVFPVIAIDKLQSRYLNKRVGRSAGGNARCDGSNRSAGLSVFCPLPLPADLPPHETRSFCRRSFLLS